ncbi:hypothetical protein GYMLUDRAFT_236189 [Collybiopsis luxurians FD-317 M1]|nr:hypothetical protein GYMLUDRAFT_236189 [Collybiopsis luxurians FD-317 M1]
MFLLFVLLSVLLLGPQLVLAALKLDIGQVTECEPVFVSFRGQLNSSFHQVPLTLQILPFNSTPAFIPLPSYAANSSGVNVTFLPVPANTQFMAALSSPSGLILSFVSDIFQVDAGTSKACLPPLARTPTFQIQNMANLSQCEDFSISIPPGSKPPLVELYNPRGFGYPLELTRHTNTTATYKMVAVRQTEVMLSLAPNNRARSQTTPLLSVQGTQSSPTNCFPRFNTNAKGSNSTSTAKPSQSSKGAIIGLSVGLGVTFVLSLPLVWLVIRERRRRKQVSNRINFDASHMERQPSQSCIAYVPPVEEKRMHLPPPFFGYPAYTEGAIVLDPSYVSEKYSPTISDYPRTSISWEYIRRNSSDRKEHHVNADTRASIQTSNLLSSSNIEKMLNMARNRASEDALGNGISPSTRSHESYGFGPSPAPPPPVLHHIMSLRDRQAPDVPHNPSFFAGTSFIVDSSVPMTESPESLGSLLRLDSGVNSVSISSTRQTDGSYIMQPARAILAGEPIKRIASPRTISREDSLAKLEKGSRRTNSNVSRFSLDSADAGGLSDSRI